MDTGHLASHRRSPQEQAAHVSEESLVLRKSIPSTWEFGTLTALCPCRLRQPRDDPPDSERAGPHCACNRTLLLVVSRQEAFMRCQRAHWCRPPFQRCGVGVSISYSWHK